MSSPWRSIIATEPNMASGLALPVPAMSGAEPCTGSNRPGPPAPSEALGSIPIEPVSMAASSLRMSPNMFSVRITSNCAGLRHQLHRRVVHQQVLELDVGVLRRRGASTTSRHSREVSSTFALSTLVTFRARELEGDAGDPLDLLHASRRRCRRRVSPSRPRSPK